MTSPAGATSPAGWVTLPASVGMAVIRARRQDRWAILIDRSARAAWGTHLRVGMQIEAQAAECVGRVLGVIEGLGTPWTAPGGRAVRYVYLDPDAQAARIPSDRVSAEDVAWVLRAMGRHGDPTAVRGGRKSCRCANCLIGCADECEYLA